MSVNSTINKHWFEVLVEKIRKWIRDIIWNTGWYLSFCSFDGTIYSRNTTWDLVDNSTNSKRSHDDKIINNPAFLYVQTKIIENFPKIFPQNNL